MDKVLWTGEYDKAWDEVFSKEYELTKASFAAYEVMPTDYREVILRGEKLQEALKEKDIFIIGVDPLKEDVLKNCPDLKMVLSVRDGPEENVDVATCTELGIPVISSSGRCSISVAEYTFELMMMLARSAHIISNQIRNLKWTEESFKKLRGISTTSSTELYGKTVGIIGMGRNGRQIATRAQAFGMKVIGFDPFVPQDAFKDQNIELKELNTVMAESDYVIVMARVTEQSKGLIGREQLECMKPTACIINTARAALLDYDALYDVLKNEKIRGAAIDTWPKEPIGADSPFYEIPENRLIISNHAAGFSLERTMHQYELLTKGFEDFKNGIKPSGLINPQVFDSPNFEKRGGKYWNINKGE